MSQTSYSTTPALAFPGMLGDARESDGVSLANGEASAVAFGIAVKRGATPEKEFALLTPAATVVGILAHKHREGSLSGTAGVAVDEVAHVVSQGSVWGRIEETVVAGDLVFVRTAAGATVGYFRNDADGGNAEALPGARFEKGGTAALGYALIDINIP
jgi:hypothetical protein